MASDQNNSSLVTLSPPSTLTFHLERGAQPKTILKVTNNSKSKVVFKVKTTQPSWYYVRPNQQMLDIGQSEDVAILLIDTECKRFLDQAEKNNEEKIDKHRFLVQSKIIADEHYEKILTLPVAQRADEFYKIWDGPKDDKKNVKLKVEFKYPSQPNPNEDPTKKQKSSVSENVESIRDRLVRSDGVENRKDDGASLSSPEAMFAELQGLRKKYDAVVEYTVHLTAERDAIVAQLENAQREINKEKSKKKGNENGNLSVGKEKSTEKRSAPRGFSLLVVIFAAIIFFLLGRYLQF